MASEEAWVDVEAVAAHLHVAKQSVYRWVDGKDFPAHRAGRLLRFKLSEVDDWVRSQRRVHCTEFDTWNADQKRRREEGRPPTKDGQARVNDG